MKLKRRKNSVPELHLASMPDLIFTILFFFMIVTHLRENTIQVQYRQPEGTQLHKVTNRTAVIDVYVGRVGNEGEYKVQVNNTLTPLADLPKTLAEARGKISSDQSQYIAASLQADSQTPMRIIQEVKIAMRKAGVLKINYSGIESENITNENNK